MFLFKDALRGFLLTREVKRIHDIDRVPSAVLLPIYCKLEQFHILFTKRTEKVKDHKGQISFPGGAYQDEDGALVDTALRESAEEIGLAPEKVEVLGELDDIATTTSNYIISPFVAFIPWPYQFSLNTEEAEDIVEVPITALLDEKCLRKEDEIVNNEVVTAYYYHYQGKVIWGATARILNQFLNIFADIINSC